MLIFGEKLLNTPLLSLQTGVEIARTELAIIDSSNLHILAYALSGKLLVDQAQSSYIRTDEIRERSEIGLIVDSADDIIVAEDIIAHKNTYELEFSPIGLNVIDENNSKLGKVIGYTVDVPSFNIVQLRVGKTGIARLANTDALVHRSQILEINDKTIIVKATATRLKDVTPIINVGTVVNPFRQQTPSQESASSLEANSDSVS